MDPWRLRCREWRSASFATRLRSWQQVAALVTHRVTAQPRAAQHAAIRHKHLPGKRQAGEQQSSYHVAIVPMQPEKFRMQNCVTCEYWLATPSESSYALGQPEME